MAEQKVELRKVRDFSEVLNDTILFIRQNFRPLLTCFLGIAGIFMLTSAILTGMYQSQLGNMLEEILNRTGRDGRTPFEFINANYFVVLFFSWLRFIAMQVAIISYIKVYEVKNGETPLINEVWDTFKRYFLKAFFYSIVILIFIFLGVGFCIAPGIYLMVVFVPFYSILVMEDCTFSEAFSRCFTLIKDNFWLSFGVYLLTYIISVFSGSIISLLISGIGGLISYFTTRNLTTTAGIVVSILNIFSFIFFVVFYVAVALHYFNLAEKHDGTGLLKRLDSIGGTDQNFENTQEEY